MRDESSIFDIHFFTSPPQPMAFLDLNDMVVSQVRQAADIVDVISQVTPLRAAGRSHKGVCPFHREKTPSFHVDRAKGLFYCFGCGVGGDVFKFLMLHERFTFPEAVEHIANRVGIELPKKKRKSDDSGREDLYEVVEDAAEAFHQALGWTPNTAETYLREQRGFSPDLWSKYGFGYAPDSWDYILTRLGRKHPAKKLEAAGLVLPRKTGDGFYDRFRNRLMVTIHSDTGAVLGFGGRSLDGSDPKYLNSPESAIFNKSNLLYNLHRAKEHVRKLERAILVEGYFDCISLDHAGVPGVVASMGTSLTPGQASLMRRFARRVVIAYDGDEAGRNATLRAAPILLSAGLTVEVIDVGAGADPDTYIRKNGLEDFMELLGNASDIFDFALQRIAPTPAAMSGTERSAAVETVAPMLGSVADPVVRNDAAHRVADHLRLEFETIWSRVRGRGSSSGRERESMAPISSGEKQLLAAVLQERLPSSLRGQVRAEFFEDGACRNLFKIVENAWLEGQALDFSSIATDVRGEAELTRLSELVLDESDSIDEKSLEETIRHMERRFCDHRLREIQVSIQEANRVGDSSREQALLLEKVELSRRLHALK